MPDDTALQSIRQNPNVVPLKDVIQLDSRRSLPRTAIRVGNDRQKILQDKVQDDNFQIWDDKEGDGFRVKPGMTNLEPDPSAHAGAMKHEVVPTLSEAEITPLGVEKLPSVEISPAFESEEKVIKEVQESDAQIPKKTNDIPPNIVDKVSGEERTHIIKTLDTLTTIADKDEEEFIKKVEQHAHVH